MDYDQLRDSIQNFSLDHCPLGNQGYNRVLLQLFGFLGHGKSALINSLRYVLSNDKNIMLLNHVAKSTAEGELEKKYHGSHTQERRAYELTPTITVVDNRGLGRMTDYEMRTIYAQLGNFMPLNKKVEWTDSYEDFVYKLEESELDPNHTDFTVPIFVYKVQHILPMWSKSKVKEFFENCKNLTGVFPIVVITFKTSGDYLKVEKMFKLLGAEVVVAVENYSENDQIQTLGRNTDFINLLKSALDHVTFQMKQPRNPKEEQIERKKFLLKHAHDIDVAEKEAKAREKERKESAGSRRRNKHVCDMQ